MEIAVGAKVVQIESSYSSSIFEVMRIFKSGRSLKIRAKNIVSNAEVAFRMTQVRLADHAEILAGKRLSRDETMLREQFAVWFKQQSFYQSFAHSLGDRIFDCDIIKERTVYRNTHLDAVWQVWSKSQKEIWRLTDTLMDQAVRLSSKDAEILSLKKEQKVNHEAIHSE